MTIRPERPEDLEAIRSVHIAAFADHPFSRQTEHLIVDALRDAGALHLSLVAEEDGQVVGHVAFSVARVGDASQAWFLLGPIGVLPAWQRRHIGSALVGAGLAALRAEGAAGCCLVGDPAFYRRFGFEHAEGVTVSGVPDEYVLCTTFRGETPRGEIAHHAAFSVTA